MIGPGLFAAFAMGFLGSAHCVGMCGPLALALPVQQMSIPSRWLSVGMYHTGRIGVYALAGAVFGLVGHQVYWAGWQQGLSIALGVSILCWQLLKGYRRPARFPGLFGQWLQEMMVRLWNKPSQGTFILMGMGNGLLPCGMVYLAIAGALTSPGPLTAIAFMTFFGLGTLPMLLGLQATGRMLGIVHRIRLRKALPYLTALMAILLILRGLNLGIPFVSPLLAGRPPGAISCH